MLTSDTKSDFRWRKDILYVVLLSLVPTTMLLGTFRLVSDVGRPFPGFLTFINRMALGYQINSLTPSWWEALRSNRFHVDEMIYTIDDQPAADGPAVLAQAAAQGQKTVSVYLTENGRSYSLTAPLTFFSFNQMLDILVPNRLLGIGWWLTALVIFKAAPAKPLNRALCLWLVLIALDYSLSPCSLFDERDLITRTFYLIQGGITPFQALALLNAVLYFRDREQAGWLGRLLLVCFTAIGLYDSFLWFQDMTISWFMGDSTLLTTVDHDAFYTGQWLINYTIDFALLRMLWFLWKTRKAQSANFYQIRRLAYGLMYGTLAGFPAAVLTALAALDGVTTSVFLAAFDLRYLQLVLPLTLGTVMTRFQSLGVNSRLLLLVLLITVSGLASSLISAFMIATLSNYPGEIVVPFLPIFSVILVTSIFWTFQNSWRGWLGRRFFRERRSYEEVQTFNAQLLNAQPRYADLGQLIARILCSQFKLERVTVWLAEPSSDSIGETDALLVRRGDAGLNRQPLPERLFFEADDATRLFGKGTMRLSQDSVPAPPFAAFSSDVGITLIVPLFVAQSLLGIICVGRRTDQEILDDRDLTILTLIGQQVTLFVQTIHQQRHLASTRLALHNNPQMFFFRLRNGLPRLIEQVVAQPEQAGSLLSPWLIDIDERARELRDINEGSYYRTVADIEHLVEAFRRHTHDLHIRSTVDVPIALDTALENQLYEWFQEGLNNVVKYAAARNVQVELGIRDNTLRLCVEDDGVGLEATHSTKHQRRSKGGLERMTEDVEAFGGKLAMTSSATGTTLSIVVPLAAQRTN